MVSCHSLQNDHDTLLSMYIREQNMNSWKMSHVILCREEKTKIPLIYCESALAHHSFIVNMKYILSYFLYDVGSVFAQLQWRCKLLLFLLETPSWSNGRFRNSSARMYHSLISWKWSFIFCCFCWFIGFSLYCQTLQFLFLHGPEFSIKLWTFIESSRAQMDCYRSKIKFDGETPGSRW